MIGRQRDLIAATAQGAHEKAMRILGDPPEGKQWTLAIDRITEELPGSGAAAAMGHIGSVTTDLHGCAAK